MKKLIILIFAVAFLSWCEAVPEYQYSIDYTKIDWTTGSITCESILIPYIREGKSSIDWWERGTLVCGSPVALDVQTISYSRIEN